MIRHYAEPGGRVIFDHRHNADEQSICEGMGDAVPGRLLAADLWLCRLVCSWRGSRSASVGDSKHPNPRPRPSQFTCSQLTAERAQQRCLSSTHRPQHARCCCRRHEEVGETDSQPRATVPDRSACASSPPPRTILSTVRLALRGTLIGPTTLRHLRACVHVADWSK